MSKEKKISLSYQPFQCYGRRSILCSGDDILVKYKKMKFEVKDIKFTLTPYYDNADISLKGRAIYKTIVDDEERTLPMNFECYGNYKLLAEENNENTQILQLLLKYNDSKCINWITDALKHYNINDNLADTYIQYNDIYLYEPTVLHIAVICENTDVIRMLIDYGADIYAEDESVEPVFMLADIINNEEIIEIFTKEYENGF